MRTPSDILEKFEQAAQGLEYGTVTLSLDIKLGKPRYIIARKESLLIDENQLEKKVEKESHR